MIRRWSIPLFALAATLGSMMAAGTASATPAAAHATPSVTNLSDIQPGGAMASAGQAQAHGVPAVRGTKTTDESTNWSGYAVSGSNGQFSSVSASWKQPAATCSSSGRRSSETFSSFWVGLDGFSSDSVEQTGTEADCDGRTADYFGWYEMFPADPVNFSNPVEPGDSFSASVTFSGTETFTLVLTDHTQGWTQDITQNQTGLDRSSAEVITEAPSSESGVLPLADFGTVTYSGATVNGTSLGSQSPTEIIMIDNNGEDKDSTSSISSSGGFSNTWIRSS
jgi:Peptidase A4 family